MCGHSTESYVANNAEKEAFRFLGFSASASVARSFWFKIATSVIKHLHKISTQKFLKIATFLGKIPTFWIIF